MKNVSIGPLTVGRLGLGCMGMSEFYGHSDERECLATLDRAFELGVNMLDTADMYGSGANEELIGRFMRGRREHVVLATKFGIVRSDNPNARGVDNSPDYVRAACDASLQRLGTDYIDLYYIHRVDRSVPIEDTIGALAGLVEAGKVRAVGLSEVSADTLRRAAAIHPIAAVQSEYSLWVRDPEPEVLPACRELGTAFVAYSPLGRRMLTGALPPPDQLAPDDFRRRIGLFQPDAYKANLHLVEAVRRLALAKSCTPAQMALAWLLSGGDGIIPIPGTRRIERLEENVAATRLELAPDELAELHRTFTPGAAVGDRTTPQGRALLDA